MSFLADLPGQARLLLFGWVLLHFLWQGALIALVLWLVLTMMQRCAAEARYTVACGAMLGLLLCPVASVFVMTTELGHRFTAYGGDAVPARISGWVSGIAGSIGLGHVDRFLAVLVIAWLFGVVVLLARLLASWMGVQRVKRSARPISSLVFQGRLSVMALRIGIRRPVQLMESTLATGPAVIGFVRPMILFPAAALTGLWPVQVEAILAHELAHIRRHDYLINLIQSVVETLLFYHPATWWVSARIREERENCADDLAVRAYAVPTDGTDDRAMASVGDRNFYAACLADLDELRPSARHLAMSAAGGSLLHRVRRILLADSHESRATAPAAALLALASLLMLGLAQMQHTVPVRRAVAALAPPVSPLQSRPQIPHRQFSVAMPVRLPFPELDSSTIWRAGSWLERVSYTAPRESSDLPATRPVEVQISYPKIENDWERDFPPGWRSDHDSRK